MEVALTDEAQRGLARIMGLDLAGAKAIADSIDLLESQGWYDSGLTYVGHEDLIDDEKFFHYWVTGTEYVVWLAPIGTGIVIIHIGTLVDEH